MIKIGKDIAKAVQKLKKGGIVVIPTETVYGLGANATRIESVKKIFKLKKRPKNDPLICHVNSLDKVRNYVKNIPKNAQILAEKFWPGPLTIIFEKNNLIPDITTSNLTSVAFRVPQKKITLKVLENLSFPVAAPSANIFGYISPTSTHHVTDNFSTGIDYILEGGNCSLGIESTIIGFENNIPIIYRLGSTTLEVLEKYIGKVKIDNISENLPGSFKNHYSPSKKLFIGNIKKLCEKFSKNKVGILCFDKKYQYVEKENQIILSERSSMLEACKNLYSSLYKFDNMDNVDIIISSLMPNSFLGKSINDRLIKSAEKDG